VEHLPQGVTNDDPFGGLAPTPTPTPPTPPTGQLTVTSTIGPGTYTLMPTTS